MNTAAALPKCVHIYFHGTLEEEIEFKDIKDVWEKKYKATISDFSHQPGQRWAYYLIKIIEERVGKEHFTPIMVQKAVRSTPAMQVVDEYFGRIIMEDRENLIRLFEARMAAMDEAHAKEMVARDEAHAKEIAAKDEAHAKEIAAKDEAHAKEMAARDEAHAKEIASLVARLAKAGF